MSKWKVLVDIDRNGGDDDVETFSVEVEADSEQDAMNKANALATAKHGEDNVLGAFDARQEKGNDSK